MSSPPALLSLKLSIPHDTEAQAINPKRATKGPLLVFLFSIAALLGAIADKSRFGSVVCALREVVRKRHATVERSGGAKVFFSNSRRLAMSGTGCGAEDLSRIVDNALWHSRKARHSPGQQAPGKRRFFTSAIWRRKKPSA
jgi:hypothetical protein